MEDKTKTKKFLIVYCIAIFAFSVALILIASVSQAKITREADEIREKLESAEVLAADSKTRLDAVMTENSRLSDKVKLLETENQKLHTSMPSMLARAVRASLWSPRMTTK